MLTQITEMQAYSRCLEGRNILIVEDDAIAAVNAKGVVELAGGAVVGPGFSLGQGFHYLKCSQVDCALLDVNLNSLLVFGLADALIERRIPVVFLNGDPLSNFPPQYRTLRLVNKPYSSTELVEAICQSVLPSQHTGTTQGSLAQSIPEQMIAATIVDIVPKTAPR